MNSTFNHNISIIGSGNVAWHMAFAFKNAGINVNSVIGRNKEKGEALANKIGTAYYSNTAAIPFETSLILICVTDSAIEEIAEKVKEINCTVAHTAGSMPLSAVSRFCRYAGVLYPFQTFTQNIRLGEVKFPVCIEANNSEVLNMLRDLGNRVSNNVIELDSEKRKKLHLSGVLANNFSNYFYSRAFDFLEHSNIDPTLLIPLIQETSNKIYFSIPKELQTGPARRGDKKTIEEHAALLAGDKNLSELYMLLSKNLMEYYKIK